MRNVKKKRGAPGKFLLGWHVAALLFEGCKYVDTGEVSYNNQEGFIGPIPSSNDREPRRQISPASTHP